MTRIKEKGDVQEDYSRPLFADNTRSVGFSNGDQQYRMISIMNHVREILLRIIQQRLYGQCGSSLGRNQFGFQPYSAFRL